MCFSASASFTTSALLIPTGIYCVRQASATNKAYIPFSLWPLFFGIQQTLEGFLWLAMQNEQINLIHTSALGFLFFSHFFWLFWTPFSVFSLEENKWLKITLISFTCIGFIYGMLLYLPLLHNGNLFDITITNHSLNYVTRFVFDDFVPKDFTFTVYALIILIPLLISSDRKVNILGYQIFTAAVMTYLVFTYAFSSVWCFFTAIFSLYMIQIVTAPEPELEQK